MGVVHLDYSPMTPKDRERHDKAFAEILSQGIDATLIARGLAGEPRFRDRLRALKRESIARSRWDAWRKVQPVRDRLAAAIAEARGIAEISDLWRYDARRLYDRLNVLQPDPVCHDVGTHSDDRIASGLKLRNDTPAASRKTVFAGDVMQFVFERIRRGLRGRNIDAVFRARRTANPFKYEEVKIPTLASKLTAKFLSVTLPTFFKGVNPRQVLSRMNQRGLKTDAD